MLWTIGLLVAAFWVVGWAGHFATGGAIDVLLVLAAIVVLFRLVQSRRLTGAGSALHNAGSLEDL